MPPLMSARTCWRAGWVVVLAGVVVSGAASLLSAALLSRAPSVGSVSIWVSTVANLLSLAAVPAGLALLVASVVLRRVEQVTASLVASGVIEVPAAALTDPGPAGTRGRALDDVVGLDGADDVVDHEPGVR